MCEEEPYTLNNILYWITKSNHFVLSSVIGFLQAFHASPKSVSSRYNVLSSLNPTTSICIFVRKNCLLLRTTVALLDFPLLCFKKMYNSTKTQPTSNAFGSIFLDHLNIANLNDQYTKQNP